MAIRTLWPLLAVVAVALWLRSGGAAFGDGPAGTVLEPLESSTIGTDRQSTILSVRLLNDQDQPLSGATVTFYMLTTVFGERLMKAGDAFTDATGTASLIYEPTWVGDHTVVVRFPGDAQHASTQTTFQFAATGPVPVHENARFGLEEVRRWLPLAVGAALLAVWATLGLVIVTTVRGLRAATAAVEPQMPLAPVIEPLRPAPFGRTLLALLALLALVAVPSAWLLPRQWGSEEVSLSTESGGLALGGAEPHDGGVTADAPQKPLAVPLVRSVQAMVFDEGGQLVPGSADLPADVALVNDRVLILDTNKGRILTVTPAGEIVPVLETEATQEGSLSGATAMAAHEERVYVANSTSGRVLVVDASGRLEEIIIPLVPNGLNQLTLAGIAVTDRGEIWLSDSANHRVMLLDRRGELRGVIGEGIPSSGEQGFDSPAGLALDPLGNVFVVDRLNGVVKQYSPLGVFLGAIGEGWLALPRSVAVDEAGRVYVSDEKSATVAAFGADGTYLGSIGQGKLQAPYGIKVKDGLLYVMDRLAGLFVFRLQADESVP
jgi:DNA-binding beta-propeller fold protein YncE